jgi:hypothetical protein
VAVQPQPKGGDWLKNKVSEVGLESSKNTAEMATTREGFFHVSPKRIFAEAAFICSGE